MSWTSSPRRRALLVVGLLLVALGAFATRGGGHDRESDTTPAPPSSSEPDVGTRAPASTTADRADAPEPDDGPPDPVQVGEPGDRVDVDSAPRLARVRGRVVDERGAPLAGVRVTVSVRMFPITRRTARTETDERGAFVLDRLVPGSATLSFRKDDYCDVTLKPQKIEIGVETAVTDVCMHRGAEIGGYARVDGQPAPGLQLWILRETDERLRVEGITVLSGREGKFVARERLPPGRYRVLAMPALQFGPFARIEQSRVVVNEFELVSGQTAHTVYVDLQSRK